MKIEFDHCFTGVTYIDPPENYGNNSDEFHYIIKTDQEMTVNGINTNELELTISGPLENSQFLEYMHQLYKIVSGDSE